ncbi:Hypothetical protein, putative [Bodo saltans]|uniref:C2H2-type domain-containing protein n=1 Tax=Bodo saltans TaxID=75058 RepID=A0A0S4JSH5_BODSA|nr:Hypothetical protein, putative [Bodo saltans]|eukprot:CUG92347.1 Hypothetical protein, putative [Bodo saltans]
MFRVEPLGSFLSANGSSSPSPDRSDALHNNISSSSSGNYNSSSTMILHNSFSQRTCGTRGIQGKNNSCYVDVPLMAMFGFSDIFDILLVAPPTASAPSPSSSVVSAGRGGRAISPEAITFFQQFLTLMIVNPLRKNGFVPSAHIMTLRSMLSELIDGSQGDQFVHQAAAEDVNMFLERLQQVLSGGPGQGGGGVSTSSSARLAPPPPLLSAAQQLLNVVVAIAPVEDPVTNRQKSVVTVEEILRANAAYPARGSAQYQQPFWVNIPRSADGQLPYTMILPSLWLADLPPTSNDGKGEVPQSSSTSSSPYHLELSAIITYDVALQHYCALFKIPNSHNAMSGEVGGSASRWVEYDSMGGAELNEAVGSTDLVPRITPAGNMDIFEACEADPVLRKICLEMFPCDEFIDFMYRSVGSPSRVAAERTGDEANEWAVFRQAVRRPYLYLYVPKPGACPPTTTKRSMSSSSSQLDKVDQQHHAYLADSLMRILFVRRSWNDALTYWQEHEVPRCLPPPPTYGCPDCDASFSDEAGFVVHMRKGCDSGGVGNTGSVPSPHRASSQYTPPQPPPAVLSPPPPQPPPSSPPPSWLTAPLPQTLSSDNDSSRQSSATYLPSPERSAASSVSVHTRPAIEAPPQRTHSSTIDTYDHHSSRVAELTGMHGYSSGYQAQRYHPSSSIVAPPATVKGKTILPRQAPHASSILSDVGTYTRDRRCPRCDEWVPIEKFSTHRCWASR